MVPDLANVRLQSSQSQLLNGRELVQFTILADVRAPGAAAAAVRLGSGAHLVKRRLSTRTLGAIVGAVILVYAAAATS